MPNSAVKPLILVVEDDPAVRNLIVAALEAHGLRHMAVETAHAAIAPALGLAAAAPPLLGRCSLLAASLCRNLSNAAPHGAGADDADRFVNSVHVWIIA